jgi:SAM-dependent methyltransferase
MSAKPPATHATDQAWRDWGEKDPYFGVITNAKYRRANLTPDALDEFFRSGPRHVGHVLAMCRKHVDPQFKPTRALDFGCGVGRLLPALAAEVAEVVGVDVSEAMLAEARSNCDRMGVGNVTLARSDDILSEVQGQFDLVHSTIVLQHIQPLRGRGLVAQLVGRLRPGGIGALHMTYAKAVHADNHGAPPAAIPPAPVSAPRGWRRLWRGGSGRATLAAPAATADPEMQMNVYPMNDILFILQRAGVQRFHADFSDHGGELGLTLYFGIPKP